MADMRMLGDDPRVYLEDRDVKLRSSGGGEGGILHCYKKVFVSRSGDLEVWWPFDEPDEEERREKEEAQEDCVGERRAVVSSFRRNFVDSEEQAARGAIRMMVGNEDRLFVCAEVWQSSDSAGTLPATMSD